MITPNDVIGMADGPCHCAVSQDDTTVYLLFAERGTAIGYIVEDKESWNRLKDLCLGKGISVLEMVINDGSAMLGLVSIDEIDNSNPGMMEYAIRLVLSKVLIGLLSTLSISPVLTAI